jgi:hypothetical protein
MKEVPPTWTRGSAVQQALKKFSYTEVLQQRKCFILSNCYYRWYEFIQLLIKLKIPVHLSKEFGGWGLPHYRGDDLRACPTFVKQALRSLFRDDQTLTFLYLTSKLGSCWNPRQYTVLGKYTRRCVKCVINKINFDLGILRNRRKYFVTSLQSIFDRKVIEGDMPAYLDNRSLEKVVGTMNKLGYLPFNEALSEVESEFRNRLLWLTTNKPGDLNIPKLRQVSTRLNKVCNKIIKACPEIAYGSGRLNVSELRDRSWWRNRTVFIRKDILFYYRDLYLSLCVHAFSGTMKYRGMMFERTWRAACFKET